MRRATHTIIACAILPILSIADTVHLKNGNSIEGIITKETNDNVTLDLGVGSMKIKKNRIQTILRSDASGLRKIASSWQRKNILHSRHVPEGLEDLARQFRQLEAARDSAIKASTRKRGLAKKQNTLQSDLTGLQEEYLEISQRLQLMDPKENPAQYNATVAKNNSLSAKLALTRDELSKLHKEIARAQKGMSLYMHSLSQFEVTFNKASGDTALRRIDPAYDVFFEELSKKLAPFRKESRTHRVIATHAGGTTIVPAAINGEISLLMIVDTGASVVTLSRKAADRLGIDLAKSTLTNATLADGKTVKGHRITLSSVTVGTASAQGVEALVLPDPPGEGIDGLLGMSFLGRFLINLDGGSQTLNLEELDFQTK